MSEYHKDDSHHLVGECDGGFIVADALYRLFDPAAPAMIVLARPTYDGARAMDE